MTQTAALHELCHHPFFTGMKEELLAELNDCTRLVGLQAGQYLGRTGQTADALYLIADGHVAIEIETPQHGLLSVQSLGAGDVVGWSWLTPPHRWRFHARALEPIRALEIDGQRLRKLCQENHELGYELLRRLIEVIGDRLAATRVQLLETMG
jgi:CRP-like cAMP-binding protein